MKTRIRNITLIVIGLLMLGTGSAWAGDRGDRRERRQDNRNPVRVDERAGNRQQRQVNRIRDGVCSGEITKQEHRRLKRQQARIQTAKRYAKADGRVTRREARRLDNLQDRASRQIYRSKHNSRRIDNPHRAHRYPQYRPGHHPRPQCRSGHSGYGQPKRAYPENRFYFGGIFSQPGFTFGLSTGGGL